MMQLNLKYFQNQFQLNKTVYNNGYNSWLIASGVFCILRKLTKKAPDAWPQVIAGTVGRNCRYEKLDSNISGILCGLRRGREFK